MAAGDESGFWVNSAGDLNFDGFADLIVGAYLTDPNGTSSGTSYVIYGRMPDTAVTRVGTNASQTLAGGNFADTLSGLGGDDELFGHDGDDTLTGGAGDDTLRGGEGSDTAIYTGDRANYTITYNSATQIFTLLDNVGSDGIDTATGIDIFSFNGVNYTAADLLGEPPPTNAAPVVVNGSSVALAAIDEDTVPPGQTVSSLVAGHFSDSDGTLRGVAISGNGSNEAQGKWQWFSGSFWLDIGNVSESSALRLNADVAIRFSPAANYNGPAPALTVHLIDDSISFVNGSTKNLVTNGTGGNTPYSTDTISIGETVNAVNDAPVLAPEHRGHLLLQERTGHGDQGKPRAQRRRQRHPDRRNRIDHRQFHGWRGRAGLR